VDPKASGESRDQALALVFSAAESALIRVYPRLTILPLPYFTHFTLNMFAAFTLQITYYKLNILHVLSFRLD
jgi:hypothetical protein